MKVVIVVALFAFVAVQLCHAAPAPDEEKKEETLPAEAVTVLSADNEKVNTDAPKAEAAAAPSETLAPAEEKKA